MNSIKCALLVGLLPVLLLSTERVSAYYDPGVQRWLTRDPVEEEGGYNLFSFVFNDPVAEIDPAGLEGDTSLGGGYSCRVDKFTTGGVASHEIHVFGETGVEVGVLGPGGWINKHGFTRPSSSVIFGSGTKKKLEMPVNAG